MKKTHFIDFLQKYLLLLSDLAFCGCILEIIGIFKGSGWVEVPYLPWLVFMLPVVTLQRILLLREISWNFYLWLSVGMNAIVLALLGRQMNLPAVMQEGRYFPTGEILILSCAALVGAHQAFLAVREQEANQHLARLDGLAVFTCFYLYSVEAGDLGLNAPLLLLCLTAMAGNMLFVNLLRTQNGLQTAAAGKGHSGMLLSAAIITAVFALTGLILGVVSGQIQSLISFILHVIYAGLAGISEIFGFFGGILDRIFRFLYGLFPTFEEQNAGIAQAAMIEEAAPEEEAFFIVLPRWVLWIFFGVVLCVGIAALCYEMRSRTLRLKQHIERVQTGLAARVNAPKHPSRFARLWKKWSEAIGYRILCLRYRTTPEGQYAALARKWSHKGGQFARFPMESPSAHILRVADLPGQELTEEEKNQLIKLADELNRIYYAENT